MACAPVRRPSPPRLLAPALAACALALGAALAGCGGSSTHTAAARLQREDLIAVSRALSAMRPAAVREIAAARAAWPAVANGLPGSGSPAAALITAASAAAAALHPPPLFGEREVIHLTGPGAGIAGLARSFAALGVRGWQMLAAALEQTRTGSPAVARFARANAPLYIESVYDAHFGLAQIGKKLISGYHALGGAGAFGSSLPEAQVRALAAAYSEAAARLHPHPSVRLGS